MPNSQKLFAYVRRSTRKLEEMDFILDFLAIYLGLEALLVFLFSLSRDGKTAQWPPLCYSVFVVFLREGLELMGPPASASGRLKVHFLSMTSWQDQC